MADVLGKRRRPQVPFPLLTPRLSSLWIGLVTPVDAGVARPLIESLASETIVTDPEPAALFDVEPMGCMDALRLAREDEDAVGVGVMLAARGASSRNRLATRSPRSSASRAARARRSPSSRSSWSTMASSAAARPRPSITAASRSESALDFLTSAAPPLVGDDPFALEDIEERLEDVDGEAAGKAALDAALHDWIGRRLGVPLWRLLGLSPEAPATSFTISIDSARGHARPRAPRGRLPRPEGQGRRRARTSSGSRRCAPSRTRRCGWTRTRAGRSSPRAS